MYSQYSILLCCTNPSALTCSTGPRSTLPCTNHSVEWPTGRCGHAATCVSGPLLVIVGGTSNWSRAISDCWIHDLTTMKWKNVILLYMCIRYCMFVLVFSYHSLTLYCNTYSLNSTRTVWDRLFPRNDLCPPKATSNTLCGDSCIAESEWKTRSVTVSGSGS